MIFKRFIFLLSMLFTTQAVALELTLEDCILLGTKQNENLKAMEAEVEIDNQEARIAFSELFPSINLESSYQVRDQPPQFIIKSDLFGQGFPPSDSKVEGEKDHYTVKLRLNQPLFTGGRLKGTHQKQSLLVEARRYQLDYQKTRLVYQIKKSFYLVLTRRHELVGVRETIITQTEELRTLKELLLAGKTTNDEIVAARSRLLFAKAAKLQAEQAYQNARDDLTSLIGMDMPVEIKEPILYATLTPEFEIHHGVTLNKRKDIKRLDAQINAADENVRVAQSSYYPQLNLEASYLKQRETDITEAEIWEAGVTMDWSLFDAGKTNAEVAKAKAEHVRLKHIRRDLERSVAKEIKSALRLVRENEMLVEAHQLQLLATEQEHSYHLELYRAGKHQTLDVLNSRAKLATANTNYRTAINHLRTSLGALEMVLSAPIEDKLIAHEIYQPGLRPLKEATATTTEPIDLPPPSIIREPSASISYPYAIQLGSFRSEKRAHSFMSTLKKDFPGKTFALFPLDGWQKVRAIQFDSKEAVEAALVELGGKGLIIHANTNNTRTD